MFSQKNERHFREKTTANHAADRRLKDRLKLRSERRDENFKSHRKEAFLKASILTEAQPVEILELPTQERQMVYVFDFKLLEQAKENLLSNEQLQQLDGAQTIRLMLNTQAHPSTNAVVESGVVSVMVDMLRDKLSSSELRSECIWTLTNICSGTHDQTSVVCEPPNLEFFVSLLDLSIEYEYCDLKELLYLLANIAADSVGHRDTLINLGIVHNLILIFSIYNTEQKIIELATWLLCNLFRGNPFANFNNMKELIPICVQLIKLDVESILYHSLYSLRMLMISENGPNVLNSLLESDLANTCVEHLSNKNISARVKEKCLQILVYIASNPKHEYAQVILNLPILQTCREILITNQYDSLKSKCLLLISNFCAIPSQLQDVMNSNILFNVILPHYFQQNHSIKIEILWIMTNMINSGNDNQINVLLNYHNFCSIFFDIFEIADEFLLFAGIEAILNILTHCTNTFKKHPCLLSLEEHGLWEKILVLDTSNMMFQNKIFQIMDFQVQLQRMEWH